MKVSPRFSNCTESGSTLFVVVSFTAVSLIVLGSALNWCMTNARLNDRNNQYHTTLAAAEAASEKVLAAIEYDYDKQDDALVASKVLANTYQQIVPLTTEDSGWSDFQFSDGLGNVGRTFVARLSTATYVPLESQYKGMYGLTANYRIVSNARRLNSDQTINVGVRQDFQLASVPVFQFAIFYSMDMEINPSPNMTVTGRVHGNANIYMQPVSTLTFLGDITCVATQWLKTKSPLDPLVRDISASAIIIPTNVLSQGGGVTLNLPLGTNNSPSLVGAIIEIPPSSEDPLSLMGMQRFYNKADMIILVSNSTVTVKSGLLNNFATTVPSASWGGFLTTNVTFYNKRELKWIRTTEIDVAQLKTWSGSESFIKPVLGRDIRSIYVADMRSQIANFQSGIKLKNGKALPSLGLTVSTPNPLYVQGNYNAPDANLGTTNTANTLPAALIGDSITVLSQAWNDANSGSSTAGRNADDTTINAAFLGGIVPSNGTDYSGGVENFPRFLEDWSGNKLAYNGSIVVMFYSKISTAPWGGYDVYSPPTRQWTFDLNFMDPAKLPPGTPEVHFIVRGQWAAVKPNVTTFP
jgi:hypothetical protein